MKKSILFVGPWKIPIYVSPELLEKACTNSSPQINKRKRSRLSASGIMDVDQENLETSLNDVIVVNPNPPPLDSRPLVLFSGFVNPLTEQRVSFENGTSGAIITYHN